MGQAVRGYVSDVQQKSSWSILIRSGGMNFRCRLVIFLFPRMLAQRFVNSPEHIFRDASRLEVGTRL